MSEEEKTINNLISAYGSVDLEQLNNAIKRLKKIPNYDDLLKENEKLQQENKRLKNILTELEEYINQHIQEWENEEDEYMKGVVAEDKDILQLIQELKEKYK